MKPRFVVDGETRLRESPELQANLRALWESIRARHECELASAGFLRTLLIEWRMAVEYRRKRRKILPSSQSLYVSGIVNARMDAHIDTQRMNSKAKPPCWH